MVGASNFKGGFTKMRKIINLLAITVIMIFSALVLGTGSAVAQDKNENNVAANENNNKETTAYQFVADRGDSQSILVRRALQLYADATNTELSEAATIYCETNIVQDLGSHWLEVGEELSVPVSSLQQYIENSRELSDQEIANWQTWANQATFNLEHVQPKNADEVHDIAKAKKERKPKDEDKQKNQKDEKTKENTKGGSANKNEESDDSQWAWVGFTAVIAGGAYWIRKRNLATTSR